MVFVAEGIISRSPSCDWQAMQSLENNETSLFKDETCRLAFDFSLGGGQLNSSSLFFLTGSESGIDPSISPLVTKTL